MQIPRPAAPRGTETQEQVRREILDAVADLPSASVELSERVTAFEQAHEVLKSSLANAEEQSTWP